MAIDKKKGMYFAEEVWRRKTQKKK